MTERVEKVLAALAKNRMETHYVETKEEAKKLALSMVPEGAICASGGSATLKETGIMDELTSGKYHYVGRATPDMSEEEKEVLRNMALTADCFFVSANAITENGELYNVDGNSNRVGGIVFGAKSVIVVAGVNKIVKDLKEAEIRVKTVAAPKNAARLHTGTPCEKLGHCIDTKYENMTDGCKIPGRMCCNFLVSSLQRVPNRIKVILVNENLGY